jgi:hypothetical protein
MSVKHYFVLRGSDDAVPEEQAQRELGNYYAELVGAGTAICVANNCERVRAWMVEDYARANNMPTVLLHFYLRRLAGEWQFRYPHLDAVNGVNLSFTLEPEGIFLKDVEINGVKYAGIRVDISRYTSVTLYDGSDKPIRKDYHDLLPTKHK